MKAVMAVQTHTIMEGRLPPEQVTASKYNVYRTNLINTYTKGVSPTRAFQWQLVVKNWHFVLPEDGKLVPKYGGESPLIFVLIKSVLNVLLTVHHSISV
jgi:hypothetical protein